MRIERSVILAPFTTFGIGGPVDYFCEVKNTKEIIGAIKWAKGNKLPHFILGGGSNLLVADEGVRGLVIKIKNKKLKIKNLEVFCEAGVKVDRVVSETIKKGLGGLEYFAGLPGTVAGAIYNNSHWKDHFFSDCLEKVEILDKDLKKKVLLREKINFSYDYSSFQEEKNIILNAIFQLKKEDQEILKKRVEEVLRARKKQPKGKSAGCIFKNPKGKSAGYLIERAGLKGKRIRGIKISEKHGNFFINTGRGKASDVLELIKLVQKKVKEKFGIELEPEIFFLGEFCSVPWLTLP